MEGRDVLIFDGMPVAVYRLADILGHQGRGADQVSDKVLVVIVEADGQRAGFVVDELLAEQEVVVKDLGRAAAAGPTTWSARRSLRPAGSP